MPIPIKYKQYAYQILEIPFKEQEITKTSEFKNLLSNIEAYDALFNERMLIDGKISRAFGNVSFKISDNEKYGMHVHFNELGRDYTMRFKNDDGVEGIISHFFFPNHESKTFSNYLTIRVFPKQGSNMGIDISLVNGYQFGMGVKDKFVPASIESVVAMNMIVENALEMICE